MSAESILTVDNFRNGMLIDEEQMAGIAELPDRTGHFAAFVLDLSLAEYILYSVHDSLSQALEAVNSVPRAWRFESTKACGNGECSKNAEGLCSIGGCNRAAPLTHCKD
jgi:hypothetical protein